MLPVIDNAVAIGPSRVHLVCVYLFTTLLSGRGCLEDFDGPGEKLKGCLYYDTCTAYMCAAHVRRTCAMTVYTVAHVRRTCVTRCFQHV